MNHRIEARLVGENFRITILETKSQDFAQIVAEQIAKTGEFDPYTVQVVRVEKSESGDLNFIRVWPR